MSNAITKVDGNGGTAIAREGFGSREIEQRHETASTAVAAQARAEIEAMYVMAMQRPRNWDDVRMKILADCRRTAFAERAFFSVPRGDKPGRISGQYNTSGWGAKGLIEDLSIRFVEAALRHAGNVICPSRTIYDDDTKRIVRVSVTDLESNITYPKDLTIEKTVERKKAKDKDVVLGSRTNSGGETVYTIACTDDELLLKENNLTSKALRTLGKRLLPGDILEESEAQIAATVRADVEQDPTAAKKKIADAFASLGIMPSQLADHLGHPLDACAPGELQMLGGMYRAIRDNEITWVEIVGAKESESDSPEAAEAKKTAAQRVADKVKARMPKKEEKPAEKPAEAAPSQASAKEEPKADAKDKKAPKTKPADEHSDAEPPEQVQLGEGRQPGED